MKLPVQKIARLLLAAATAFAPVAGAQERDLLIGTTAATSSHYGYFVAVSQLINAQVANVRAAVVETGATIDNLRRLSRKQIDIGLVTTNAVYQAENGKGKFEGAPVKTRLLWVYAVAPQNVVVRGDSGIKAIAELGGKPFNPGIRGSSTEATSEAVFAALGVVPDYVRGSTGDIVASIKDNRLAGYVKSGAGKSLDASTRDIATAADIAILGLSEKQAKTIADALPDLSIVGQPGNKDLGIAPYTTWAFAVAATASPDLDEETAYQIVKAIAEDETVQASAMASLKGFDIAKATAELATIPLHPGAAKYLREKGFAVGGN